MTTSSYSKLEPELIELKNIELDSTIECQELDNNNEDYLTICIKKEVEEVSTTEIDSLIDAIPPLECVAENDEKGNRRNKRTNVLSNKAKKVFHCLHCSYVTIDKSNMKKHEINKHTPIDRLVMAQCDKCSYVAKHKENLKKHMTMHEAKMHECVHCKFKTKYKASLKKHYLSIHTPDGVPKAYQCEHCEFKGARRVDLDRHLLRHGILSNCIEWLNCTQCDYRTRWRRDLKRHMLRHVPEDEREYFYCEKCPYKSVKKCNLQAHTKHNHFTDVDDEEKNNLEWIAIDDMEVVMPDS